VLTYVIKKTVYRYCFVLQKPVIPSKENDVLENIFKLILELFSRCVQASAAMYIRYALFWVVKQRVVLIPYRSFGTIYRSHLQESRSTKVSVGPQKL
jgi:hypothetical protein